MKKCKLPYKTAEANAKAALRTRGAIDKFLNITDLATFQKENKSLTEHGKRAYGLDRTWFYSEQYGTKAVPNTKAFREVDGINGVNQKGKDFYQKEPVVRSQEKVRAGLQKFLKALNFTVDMEGKLLDQLQKWDVAEKNDVLGATDILQKIVSISKGNEAVLNRQAAFIMFEFLGRKSVLHKNFWFSIHNWSQYKKRYKQHINISGDPSELDGIDDERFNDERFNPYAHKEVILDFLQMAFNTTTPPKVKRPNRDVDMAYLQEYGVPNPYKYEGFIQDLVKVFADFKIWLSGIFKPISEQELIDVALDIVDDIFKEDYKKFTQGVERKGDHLVKPDGTILHLKDYDQTLKENKAEAELAMKLVSHPFINAKLSGSLVTRLYGTTYRSIEESLHDIDMVIPLETVNTEENFQGLLKAIDRYLRTPKTQRKPQITAISQIIQHQAWYKNMEEVVGDFKLLNVFIGKDHKIGESITVTGVKGGEFKNGKYVEGTGTILDFFVRTKEGSYPEIFDNYWKDWKQIFEAKIKMGRAKDIMDLIYFDPFIEDKFQFTNKGFRYFDFAKKAPIEDNKPSVSSPLLTEQETELNGKLKKLLQKVGVKYEAVEKILDGDGNEVAAIAKANTVQKLIQVVEGSQDRTTLPEETATIILSLMGRNHPLMKSMMSEVENTDTYKEVLQSYGQKYTGFEDISQHEAIKFEAVTKIVAQKIADNFKDSKPAVESRVGRWFKRLWKWVTDTFSAADSGEYKDATDSFYLAAEKILNADLKDVGQVADIKGEFYQLKPDPDTVNSILTKLDETQKRILEPTYDENDPKGDRYRDMFDGFVRYVTNRPTDAQGRLFERTMGKETAKVMNDSPKSVMQREFGIKLHELSQKVIDAYVNGGEKAQRPPWFPQDHWNGYLVGIKEVVEQAQGLQNRIDPDGKAIFKTENRVFDPDKKQDMAGSIDLLVIFSDATAARYDWKFVNYKSKTDATGEKTYDPDSITPIKERSYNLQASEYDRMLRDVYGVKKIRQSRVIPINVQYSYNSKTKKYTLRTVDISNKKEYLNQVPLARESITFDAHLNELLTSLQVIRERISDRASSDFMNERLQKKLKTITKQVRALQLNHDITPTIQVAHRIVAAFKSSDGINDPENDNYLNDEELVDMAKHLLLYSKMDEFTFLTQKDFTPELKREVSDITTELKHALKAARTMMITRLRDHAKTEEVLGFTNEDDSLRAQKAITQKQGQFRYLHRFDQPIMKMLSKAIDNINDTTRINTDELAKEIEVHNKALQAWGKDNGYKGSDILKHIINPNTGNLIGRYTAEFYKKREKASANKDVAWLKANLHVSAESQRLFDERKTERFKHYDIVYKDDAQTLEFVKEKWLNRFDPSREIAWTNKDNYYLQPKQPSKWESDKWKFMQNNKPLKDFYEYHRKKMEEFAEILPGDIKSNFVANVHKDMIDQLFEQGVFTKAGWKGMAAAFMQSFQVREGDSSLGMVDPETGRKIRKIPILYVDPIMDIGGNIDNTQKSLNLTKSLLLFGTMAYNHQAASKQEAKVNMMREVLEVTPTFETDTYGNPKYTAGEPSVIKGDKQTLQTFDAFVNYYLYGQKLQSLDSTLESKTLNKLNERLSKKGVDPKTLSNMKVSGNKLWRSVLTFHSMKTLGLNLVSAAGGFAGALGNTFISGAKQGAYHNNQIIEAMINKAKRDKKHMLLSKFFEVAQENYNYIKADKVSIGTGAKWLTQENAFFLHRVGDEIVDDFTLEAMSKNYGVDVDGKIKKLSRIKSNPKSLWDIAKVADGSIEFPNIPITELNRFRRMVREIAARNKGNSSHENINLIQTHMAGKTMMQFKSWMPAMINERFGDDRYNDILDEIELGRFRIAFGEVFHEGVIKSAQKLAELGLEVMTGGLLKPFSKGNSKDYTFHLQSDMSKHYFAKFLKENSQLLEKFSEAELYQMYVETKVEQLRATAAELRVYALTYGFMAAVVALVGGGEGDDEESNAFRQFLKILDRAQLELGVFLNPNEYASLAKNFIPIVGLAQDIMNLGMNTLDELKDIFYEEEGIDWKGPRFKYTLKITPFVKGVADLFMIIDVLDEWDNEDE